MSKPSTPSKRRRSRTYIVIAAVFLLCIFLLGWTLYTTLQKDAQAQNNQTNVSLPLASEGAVNDPALPQEHTVRFSAVGDNLIHNGIYMQAEERTGGNGYDFNYVYEQVKYFFEPYDVNWINQETLVSWDVPPSTYPMFSTPGELGVAAYDAGWRVFAMSNNHSYDKGATGISSTLRYWEEMPDDVVTTGFYRDDADDSGISLQEVNGITIAYVAFTESTNGIPTPESAEAHVVYTDETDKMAHLIQRAAELADAVVVCVHWGTENSHEIRPDQREMAANFADWGADAVIGTHPHVVQGIEWVDGTASGKRIPVAYSLGNFLSAQSQANQMIGLCYTFDIKQTIQPDGTRDAVRIENVKAYPTVTHYDNNYENVRCYMYRDYTEELASQHGVRSTYPSFDMNYIQEVVSTHVDSEFLVLD